MAKTFVGLLVVAVVSVNALPSPVRAEQVQDRHTERCRASEAW